MSEQVAATTKTTVSPSRLWCTILSTACLVIWVLFMLLMHFFVRLLMPGKLERFFMVFHRGCCWIFSLRYQTQGALSSQRPTLFLCNHISYLDIFPLGAVIPGHFIAKSEVANWPILGSLAKVQNTLFFERKGRKVRDQLSVMTDHFNRGGNLILFPEGTSTEGEHVEPFKSSLLQSMEKAEQPVSIQPVTIAYTHYKNKPMDRFIRDHYAWYGTMPFASHFFSALGLSRADVKIIFHKPVLLNDFETRKDCASFCWQQVADGLQHALGSPD